MRREAKMYSKLMIFTLGPSRTAWFRRPAPLVNARALEDVWLTADAVPPQVSPQRIGLFRRWQQIIADPVAARDAIYSP
jgi:hypothetical protein